MKNKIILWLPRILSIVFVCFLTLFSLDVFGTGLNWWQTIGAFLIHSIPSIILAVIVYLSWKRPQIGGVAFILAGLAYIILTLTSKGLPWYLALSWSTTIAGPAILTGVFYLLSWRRKKSK